MRSDSRYYEAGPIHYSFRLLHDMPTRIAIAGSDADFAKQLDRFFGYDRKPVPGLGGPLWTEERSLRMGEGRFDGLNNETMLETPYACAYAGRHDRTCEIVQSVRDQRYADTPGGIPCNDDAGALSSWYVWTAIGLFPVFGQGILLIGAPMF